MKKNRVFIPVPEPAPSLNERLAFTVDELLSIHPGGRTMLYSEIRSGKLKARKMAGRTVILRSDYEAYLNDLPTVPTSEELGGDAVIV